MVIQFYEGKSEKGKAVIDEHLKRCYVLALPTTRGQKQMYDFALEPLKESGRIAGYSVTTDSKEAFEKLFDKDVKENMIVIVHGTSDLINKVESERREVILDITKEARGFHPIYVDSSARDSVDLETGKHYSIKNGIPSVFLSSHIMQPCEEIMHRVLALSGYHLDDNEDPRAA